jgi:peptidyl-prolyl cis-trans isomerase B (cyclophilin B)
MARTNDPDSASSQFFIMHETSPFLDRNYAAFGYVLAGMDVVDAIATCKVEGDSNAPMPVETVVIESVTFVQPNK